MPSLIFRGVTIRHIDLRRSPNGEAVFVRCHMSAEFSETVMEEMEWGRLAKGQTSAKLEGELAAQDIAIKPNAKSMASNAIKMTAKSASDFSVVLLRQGEGKLDKPELRFTVTTAEPGAYTTLGDYLSVVGTASAQMTVSYAKQSVIMDETVGATEEQRQAVMDI